jgi:hypothetical protein
MENTLLTLVVRVETLTAEPGRARDLDRPGRV